MRRLLILGTLVWAALMSACATAGHGSPNASYLYLINGTTHIVRVYYVRGGQWYRLTHADIGIADERRVRLPAGARDGYGKILLAVEYMDGLMRMDQRKGVAMMPFFVEPCTEVPVRITYPAGGTGQSGPPEDLCRGDPGYGPGG